ncbi:D-alanyl-D-alanine carboxypeptidase family protein [Ornithinibacillus sp. JPR2-1]|uniref:D-alanyl-D-alanine carboxypeptidase family protein n=1 Tax=Ornithinibacillus sp. JPR2-1 TaxID=2094019 RepID=UPI0031D140A8
MRIRVCLSMFILFCLHSLLFGSTFAAAEERQPPRINSGAAILGDANTSTVIYEKNSSKKLYPASLTKIATAIYAIEQGELDDVVTVSEHAYRTEGSSVFLEEGEQLSLRQLIKGLLVNSANDAGVAIAEHLSGDVEHFSDELNKYLEQVIGVKNTHFSNPHGLYDAEHVTSAEDLAMITQYAINNEDFREIFGLTELEWKGKKWQTTLYTHHKLLREAPYPGVNGGKTGYVPEAGFTLATTASRKNLDLIVITLDASTQESAYQDTVALLDYGFDHFKSDGKEVSPIYLDGEAFRKLANNNKRFFIDREWPSFTDTEINLSHHLKVAELKQNSIPGSLYDVVIIGIVLLAIWFIFYYRKSKKE